MLCALFARLRSSSALKAILTYHSLDASGSVISVHPQRFAEHMAILADKRVPVVHLSDLLEPTVSTGVAITFDDGFENFVSAALPTLRAHGFPASVFVATEWVGRRNGWDVTDSGIARLPLMDWATLAGIAGDLVRIESHGCAHARLPGLAPGELRRELEASREVIAREIGVTPSAFAYPYGEHNESVARATADCGYAYAVTTELRELGPTPARHTLPRVDAYYLAPPGFMERWGTAGLGSYLRFRNAARRVRASLEKLRA